jgi:uncharacterized membrane protein YecN with MAPEG domain
MTTPIYTAILALTLILLSINVIKSRRKFGVAIDDGTNIELQRRIRAQANFSEYSPMFLILLFCAEYSKLAPLALHFFGVIFLVGRFMHAYSLLKAEKYEGGKLANKPIWRIRGMICTFFAIGSLAVILLLLAVL